MLTTEEPTEPAETGRLEEDGGPGAHPEDTAVLSGEDSQAEQMLVSGPRLQRQVARLHEAFRSQESRWAAAQRQLQSQMDALTRQNLQLWVGLKASGPPRPGAGEAVAAGSQSAFGKMLPLSTDEEILLKHADRRSHSATVIGQRQSSKHAGEDEDRRNRVRGDKVL
uniref:Uncharacterized protein n=1 Tax=Ursus americanus TaxID=9643 RepID=A0A452S998_URSAM